MQKKRNLYSCMNCQKITSTTNKHILEVRLCKKCRGNLL